MNTPRNDTISCGAWCRWQDGAGRLTPLVGFAAREGEAGRMKIISWNLLRLKGASLEDLVGLVRRERPDLLLMQEVTGEIAGLTLRVGGYFARTPLPGRIHGLAMWSAAPMRHPPSIVRLPKGS